MTASPTLGTKLSVGGLVAGYGPIPVVNEMSVEADRGKLVGIIGPNGSGKSTFIKAVMGIVKPTGGTVTLGGVSIYGQRPDQVVRAGVGYVPQVADVFVNLTVNENLLIGGYLHRDTREERKEHVLGLFPILTDRLKQRAGTLSGGERRLLAIARTLMSYPAVILMDEPSAGLAPSMVKVLLAHLETLREAGLTLVVVEQNVRAILSVADSAYVMVQGRCALKGPARDLGDDLPQLGRIFMGHAIDQRRPTK